MALRLGSGCEGEGSSQLSGGGCWRPEAGEGSAGVCHLCLGSRKAEPGAKLAGYFLLGVGGPGSTSVGGRGRAEPRVAARCLNWFQEPSKLRIGTVCRARRRAERFTHQLPVPRAHSPAPGGPDYPAFQIVPMWALNGVPGVSSAGEPSAGGQGSQGRPIHLSPEEHYTGSPVAEDHPGPCPRCLSSGGRGVRGQGDAWAWVLPICTCASLHSAGESGVGQRPNPDPSMLPESY